MGRIPDAPSIIACLPAELMPRLPPFGAQALLLSCACAVCGVSARTEAAAIMVGNKLIDAKGIVPPETGINENNYSIFLEELSKRNIQIKEL